MAISEHPAIVLDTGSSLCRVGFAGEQFPRSIFPSVVGRFRNPHLIEAMPDIYCGNDAIRNRGFSILTWPVRKGFVTDWDELEKLWFHAFYKELYAAPEEYKVLHVINPLISKKDKEMIAEVMFENFNIKALYMACSPALVLHATGRTSGLVWEAGAYSAYAAPVFEGFALRNAIIESPLNGEALSDCLQNFMSLSGYKFTTPIERHIINTIKAKFCYVAKDYDEELIASEHIDDMIYDLPDGSKITIGKEKFQCPETLFQPSIGNFQCPSIVDTICSSIENCDLDLRPLLYDNIAIAGGSSMFKGLELRLSSELSCKVKFQPGFHVTVHALSTRHYGAWTGGSILASLSSLKNSWVTAEEYSDTGSEIVHCSFF